MSLFDDKKPSLKMSFDAAGEFFTSPSSRRWLRQRMFQLAFCDVAATAFRAVEFLLLQPESDVDNPFENMDDHELALIEEWLREQNE